MWVGLPGTEKRWWTSRLGLEDVGYKRGKRQDRVEQTRPDHSRARARRGSQLLVQRNRRANGHGDGDVDGMKKDRIG